MGGYECIYCNVYPSLNMVSSSKIIEKENQHLQTLQALQSHKPLDGAFLTAASPGVVALFQVVWWWSRFNLVLQTLTLPSFLSAGQQAFWFAREIHRSTCPRACKRVSLMEGCKVIGWQSSKAWNMKFPGCKSNSSWFRTFSCPVLCWVVIS